MAKTKWTELDERIRGADEGRRRAEEEAAFWRGQAKAHERRAQRAEWATARAYAAQACAAFGTA